MGNAANCASLLRRCSFGCLKSKQKMLRLPLPQWLKQKLLSTTNSAVRLKSVAEPQQFCRQVESAAAARVASPIRSCPMSQKQRAICSDRIIRGCLVWSEENVVEENGGVKALI